MDYPIDFLSMDSTIRALLFAGVFLVSLAAALWLFYDAQTRGVSGLTWKIGAAIGTLLTLPALIVSAFNLDVSEQNLVNPLSFVGLGGLALSLIAVLSYLVFSRRTPRMAEEAETVPPPPLPAEEETTHLRPQGPEPTRIARWDEINELAFVVEKTGSRAGTIHRLRERTIIGRDSGDDRVVLDDQEVSRDHASIRLQDGRFVLRDLDSANGTWLLDADGRRKIEAPHALSERDRIQVGPTILVFTQVKSAGN